MQTIHASYYYNDSRREFGIFARSFCAELNYYTGAVPQTSVRIYVFSDFQKRDLLRFLSDVSKSRKKSLTTVYSSILRSVIIVIRVSYLSVNLVYLGTYRTLTYFLVNVNTASAFLSKMFDAGLWCC